MNKQIVYDETNHIHRLIGFFINGKQYDIQITQTASKSLNINVSSSEFSNIEINLIKVLFVSSLIVNVLSYKMLYFKSINSISLVG